MNKTSIILLRIGFFLFFSVAGLTALFSVERSDSTTHSLTLNGTFLNPNFSDQLVTPFHTHGLGGGGEVVYGLRTNHFGLDTGLKGGGGRLFSGNSNFVDHEDFFAKTSFYLNTAYSFPLFGENGHLLVGLRTEYQVELFLLSHIDSYDWTGDLSFLPSVAYEYEFKGGRLTTSLAFSLFSLVNRPPWTIYDDDLDQRMSSSPVSVLLRGEAAAPNRYFRMIYDLHWETRLSSHFLLNTGGSFQYIRTSIPQNAIFFTTAVDLGVKYVF